MTISIPVLMILSATGGALIGALLVWLWLWHDSETTDFAMTCHQCDVGLRLKKAEGWLYAMHRTATFVGAHTNCNSKTKEENTNE